MEQAACAAAEGVAAAEAAIAGRLAHLGAQAQRCAVNSSDHAMHKTKCVHKFCVWRRTCPCTYQGMHDTLLLDKPAYMFCVSCIGRH